MRLVLENNRAQAWGCEMADPASDRAWMIGDAFLQGILLEVATYPKPGLVCPGSSGSHQDMNFMTFMAGSAALAPAFFRLARTGLKHQGTPNTLWPVIRELGVKSEARLLAATNGVNTQRGALFACGVLCGAAGLASQTTGRPGTECILETVRAMTRGLVAKELLGLDRNKADKTAGERLYLAHGLTGIRGEVETGFPSVAMAGLPALKEALNRSAVLNDCLVHTLLVLMTNVDDSTIVHRCGIKTLAEVKTKAGEVLSLGGVFTPAGKKALYHLERDFVQKRISPGGSADLLSATIGLYLLENGQWPTSVR